MTSCVRNHQNDHYYKQSWIGQIVYSSVKCTAQKRLYMYKGLKYAGAKIDISNVNMFIQNLN